MGAGRVVRTVGGGMEPPRAGTDVTTPTGGILLTGAGGMEA